jgi:TRAP-type C4-dicarboxylate transport system substrate-binding protein
VKKLLALFLALMMSISLISCASSTKQETPSAPAATDSAAPAEAAQPETKDDTVYSLKVTQHDPATSATGQFLEDLASRVEKASDGRIDVEVFHGASICGPKDTIDFVSNGSVDIGWGLQSFYSGSFPGSEAIALPMLKLENAVKSSYVFWHLYADTDYLKNEYADYKVLLVHANCQSPISTKNVKIESVDDLKGMNIRGNAGPPKSFIQNLGASPVSVAIGELYAAIGNNTIDAVITDWHAIQSFKLFEPLQYYLDEDIGVSAYFFLMNWDSYNNLPADLQAVIDENSGAACLEYCGQYWNDVEATCKASIEADKGEIYKLSDAEHAKLQAVADDTIQQWIAGAENGQQIYDKINELIAQYDAKAK